MTRLRQVVIAATDYEKWKDELTDLLKSFVTYKDPDIKYFGLRNGLIPVGNSFLEIVTPLDLDDASKSPAGRFIRKNGEGGYMIIVQVAGPVKMKHAYETAEKKGLRIIHQGGKTAELVGSSFQGFKGPGFDQDGIFGFHLHPKDIGCIAEITIQKPRNRWYWAGNNWYTSDERTKIAHSPSVGFAGVEIACENPQKVARNWQELLGFEGSPSVINEGSNDVQYVLTLEDEATLTFRKSRSSSDVGLTKILIETHSTKIRNNETFKVGNVELCFVKHLDHSANL
mmetsp:Transcript_17762/g.21657  ORF Transcript_17762/g.21657 Transcript_17762/m.21657 type:complete len:284 (-) Transcript_17762:1182-2033(-)